MLCHILIANLILFTNETHKKQGRFCINLFDKLFTIRKDLHNHRQRVCLYFVNMCRTHLYDIKAFKTDFPSSLEERL